MSSNSAGPSQIAALLASTLLTLSPAMAEVCDKAVGESWHPKNGPVWLLSPVGPPVGLVIMIGGLLAAAKNRWIGYLGSGVFEIGRAHV